MFCSCLSDKYSKIINASIFVIGICTCGVSVLLWWLYEEITGCSQAKKSNFKGMYICMSACAYVRLYVCKYPLRLRNFSYDLNAIFASCCAKYLILVSYVVISD